MGEKTVKGLAAAFVAAVLGLQAAAIVRPQGARLYPFIDYPMYSRSYRPGAVYRVRELRAWRCRAGATRAALTPGALGMRPYALRDRMAAVARGTPTADRARATITRAALRAAPDACAFEIWERAIALTPEGVDPAAFQRPTWTLLRAWTP